MKQFVRTVIFGVLVGGGLGGPAWGQSRVATIDSARVFEGYWKTKQALATFKDRVADMDKDLAAMVQEYKKGTEEFQKLDGEAKNPALSTEEKDRRKRTADDKFKSLKDSEASIKQFKESATTTLDEQRKRMRDNLLVDIRAAIAAKAKASNYTMVLDTAVGPNSDLPIVLYSSSESDISKDVLDQLNLTDPGAGAGKPEEKKDPKKDDKKK